MTTPPTQHDSEQMPTDPAAPHVRRRLLGWWEALPARRQVLWGWVGACVALGIVHIPFVLAGNITWGRAIGYAVSEALPAALLVTFATQTELARRRSAGSLEDPPTATGDTFNGSGPQQ